MCDDCSTFAVHGEFNFQVKAQQARLGPHLSSHAEGRISRRTWSLLPVSISIGVPRFVHAISLRTVGKRHVCRSSISVVIANDASLCTRLCSCSPGRRNNVVSEALLQAACACSCSPCLMFCQQTCALGCAAMLQMHHVLQCSRMQGLDCSAALRENSPQS